MKHWSAWFTLIAVAAFVLSPLVTDPFSGFDPARFPVPQIDPPVQPAGYAFGIWGVIYLWLCVFGVMGVTPARRAEPGWQAVHWPLVLSLAPGAFWLWIAGFAPIAATLLIFWMAGFAILALLRAPRADRWLVQAPVALYAGWLTAAAHVSLGVNLAGFGLLSETGATILSLASATLITVIVQTQRPHAPEYGAAVIWALIGVLAANLGGAAVILSVTTLAIVLTSAVMLRGLWSGQTEARL